ncbi:MAG TPA: hypothetical protein VI956_00135 [Nitrospirota bacterium]|nr:hypothetical protein [Nitrospirota bacterium]
MNNKRNVDGIAERLKIQEKALSNLADSLKKHESEIDEEVRDILSELKALKVFLSRNIPEFKKEFPEIQRKLK